MVKLSWCNTKIVISIVIILFIILLAYYIYINSKLKEGQDSSSTDSSSTWKQPKEWWWGLQRIKDANGKDLPHRRSDGTISKDICRQECRNNTDCVAYNWTELKNPRDRSVGRFNDCYLLKSTWKHYGKSNDNFKKAEYYERNIADPSWNKTAWRKGDVSARIHQWRSPLNPEECRQRCVDQSGCVAYDWGALSYRVDDKWKSDCILLNSKSSHSNESQKCTDELRDNKECHQKFDEFYHYDKVDVANTADSANNSTVIDSDHVASGIIIHETLNDPQCGANKKRCTWTYPTGEITHSCTGEDQPCKNPDTTANLHAQLNCDIYTDPTAHRTCIDFNAKNANQSVSYSDSVVSSGTMSDSGVPSGMMSDNNQGMKCRYGYWDSNNKICVSKKTSAISVVDGLEGAMGEEYNTPLPYQALYDLNLT